jgi:hypothetical protein
LAKPAKQACNVWIKYGLLIAPIKLAFKVTDAVIKERKGRLGFMADTGTHTCSIAERIQPVDQQGCSRTCFHLFRMEAVGLDTTISHAKYCKATDRERKWLQN